MNPKQLQPVGAERLFYGSVSSVQRATHPVVTLDRETDVRPPNHVKEARLFLNDQPLTLHRAHVPVLDFGSLKGVGSRPSRCRSSTPNSGQSPNRQVQGPNFRMWAVRCFCMASVLSHRRGDSAWVLVVFCLSSQSRVCDDVTVLRSRALLVFYSRGAYFVAVRSFACVLTFNAASR